MEEQALLKDVLFVEKSIGRGFGDVFGQDVGGGGHVSDGAGKLYDTGAGTGGEPHVVDDSLQKLFALCAQRTILFYVFVVHGGVAEYFLSFKAFSLNFPCS